MSGRQIGGIVLVILGIDMIFKINLLRLIIPIAIIALGVNLILRNRTK